jgi:hypothetical protein
MDERLIHPRLEKLREKKHLEREREHLEQKLQQERQEHREQMAKMAAENRRLKLMMSQRK